MSTATWTSFPLALFDCIILTILVFDEIAILQLELVCNHDLLSEGIVNHASNIDKAAVFAHVINFVYLAD